jgi:hypothetical protein
VLVCLERHVKELLSQGVVQRCDDTYRSARFNLLSPRFW